MKRIEMGSLERSWRGLAALVLALALAACGLGQRSGGNAEITDPVVAATVNGRPIYVEDVRNYAVQRGYLREGEDLDANSDQFYLALEEMIEVRLFANEAEERGLDRDPGVRRRIELARERVLYNAITEELQDRANDTRTVERTYNDNARRLGQGEEVHLRHIQFETRDAALAAKRRLDNGERFEALALELSTDRETAADGGDLGFTDVDSLPQPIAQLATTTAIGGIAGPVRSDAGWHLLRVDDRRQRGVPSLETLRPQIRQWLFFQEMSQLRDRLENEARIERLRQPSGGRAPRPAPAPPGAPPSVSSATPPAASGGATPAATTPAAAAAPPPTPPALPTRQAPPPFPFPMGPGGVYGGGATAAAPSAPLSSTPAPGAGTQRPIPAAPAPPASDEAPAPTNGLQRGLPPATAPSPQP